MLPYGPKSENGLRGVHKASPQKHLKILTKYYAVIIVICCLPYNDHPLISDSSTIWKKKCQTLISWVILKILFVRTKNIIHNWDMDLFLGKCLNGCVNRIIAVRGKGIRVQGIQVAVAGIAANLLGRRFLGIDQEEKFLEMSKARREELNSIKRREEILEKLEKQAKLFQDSSVRVLCEPVAYGYELPF